MPKLLDGLTSEKRGSALRVLHNISALEANAIAYEKEINGFNEQLSLATSVSDFHNVVQNIIAKGKEVYDVLYNATKGMDEEISKAVDECIQDNPKLSRIMKALHFNDSLSNSIIATKERLSEHVLFGKLSDGNKDIVEKFLVSVKELKVTSDLLLSQKEVFQKRLRDSKSMDEVDSLDDEITAEGDKISAVYGATVIYPTDEATAGALIDFLDENQHIRAIIGTFDFYESLADDIMGARARMVMGLSLGK